jgi:hypothetical protein
LDEKLAGENSRYSFSLNRAHFHAEESDARQAGERQRVPHDSGYEPVGFVGRTEKDGASPALKPRILISLLSFSMNSGRVLSGASGCPPLGGTQAAADRLSSLVSKPE